MDGGAHRAPDGLVDAATTVVGAGFTLLRLTGRLDVQGLADTRKAVDVLLGRAPEPYERFHVLPGVEVRAGMQVLVDPEGSLLQPHDGHPVHDLEHPERAVALPGGRVLHPHGVGCG